MDPLALLPCRVSQAFPRGTSVRDDQHRSPHPSLKARPFSASYVTRASLLAAWALGTVSKSTYFVDSKKDAMDKEDALGPGILGRREGGLGMTCLLVMRLLFFFFK